MRMIPVKERLPLPETEVIALWGSVYEFAEYIVPESLKVAPYWADRGGDTTNDEVTHWMPKPDPTLPFSKAIIIPCREKDNDAVKTTHEKVEFYGVYVRDHSGFEKFIEDHKHYDVAIAVCKNLNSFFGNGEVVFEEEDNT